MIEDSEIKTTISPFAVRNGEEKVFDGNDNKYVSMDSIVRRINMGQIDSVHFKIIELVNEFEFMTSRQIFQLLQEVQMPITSQDKLNKKLEQLVRLKILNRYGFTSEEGKCVYKVYCLEKMGKYLLNSKEILCRWRPTDNLKEAAMVKKRLAGNQVLIAYMQKVSTYVSHKVIVDLNAKAMRKHFRATGGLVKLSKNEKSIDFLFEILRRENDWEKKLEDKMKLYKDFYDNFVMDDCGFEKMPQLILVCEDNKHTIEVYKEIVKRKLKPQAIKLYFTTDLKQISGNLSKSLMEFKLDEETKKYKIEVCDLKLLE